MSEEQVAELLFQLSELHSILQFDAHVSVFTCGVILAGFVAIMILGGLK